MSNVDLIIAGRTFTIACAEGEEAHVTMLGRMVDGKLAAMGDSGGKSESRMLLFAALLLADELHDVRQKAAPGTGTDDAQLGRIASRLENLATRLEDSRVSA
jgi:cell division protein ZapA